MFAMIIRKKEKTKYNSSDSLPLRKQPRSEHLSDEDLEFALTMHRVPSHSYSIEEDELSFLESARQQFWNLKHQYGMARVSLAIAVRKMELADQNFWYVHTCIIFYL